MDPAFVEKAYARIRELFASTTPTVRWTIGLAAVAAVGIVACLGSLRADRQYVDLMRGSPISAAELPAMEAALAKANLHDHEIRDGSIHVPRGREAAYMAALADAGELPPNFGDAVNEAIRDGNLFMSGRDREELIKKATQAELSLMIRSMRGIENAYVLYDVDRKPGFKREKLITASVSVKPVGNEQLDEGRVLAIRHTVAGAIAGLKPEDVTVSDLNGRTWHGDVATGGDTDGRRLALKRTYEQDLKAKMLNSLGFIPNVTIEPSVTLDRESLTPVAARASVGVPNGYFTRIWRQRAAAARDGADASITLERVQSEEIAKIQRHVAQLLPAMGDDGDPAELVTVTSFEEIGAGEPAMIEAVRAVFERLGMPWRVAGLALVGLLCMLLLYPIIRGGISERGRESSLKTTGNSINFDDAAAFPPAPHWMRPAAASVTPHEELSALVDRDPEAAANVLRNWIGQAS